MPRESLVDDVVTAAMPDLESSELLDNPIWNALRSDHAPLALGDDRARRYPPFIGPLSGVADQSAACYEALRPLADSDGVVVLFSVQPPQPTAGWELLRGGKLDQMVCSRTETRLDLPHPAGTTVRRLTAADAPAMLGLAELTEPGPFRLRTLELGTFYGIFESGRLMGMAGKRLHLPGCVEISAVCTHPDARGRGYAALLVSLVRDEIVGEGKTAFLHVLPDNQPAIHVYEKLGFKKRQTFHLAVLKNVG